jgi:hypothetical protein
LGKRENNGGDEPNRITKYEETPLYNYYILIQMFKKSIKTGK